MAARDRPGAWAADPYRGSRQPRGVRLLIELGFNVNVRERTAALHEAAMRGNLAALALRCAHWST